MRTPAEARDPRSTLGAMCSRCADYNMATRKRPWNQIAISEPDGEGQEHDDGKGRDSLYLVAPEEDFAEDAEKSAWKNSVVDQPLVISRADFCLQCLHREAPSRQPGRDPSGIH